ncbi:MAG: hypothetical protein ACE5I1_12000 [bacterium]
MESIFKLLISGYVIGLVCMSYLILRSWNFKAVKTSGQRTMAIAEESEVNWLGIALFSMAVSYVWCFIGAVIHFLMDSNIQFLQFSIIIALATSLTIYSINTTRKLDKIVVNSIVMVGCGLLFSNLF